MPYVSSTKYNLVNPYHVNHFNEYSFDFFKKLKGSAVEKNNIYFHKIYHKYYYFGFFKLIPYPFNRWCKNHLFNVVKKIDFGLIAIKNDNEKLNFKTKKELKKLFKEIYSQRIPYNKQNKPKKTFLEKLKTYTINWLNGEI